jgi:TonB-dependent starch-binding outer membrane protein SusC
MKKFFWKRRDLPLLWNKWLKIMKLTFLFILIGLIELSASVYSQTTKLTLSKQNSRVIDVLELIEQQSEFRFAYSSEYINLDRKVSINAEKMTIEEILHQLFDNAGVKFSVTDRHILLYPQKLDSEPASGQQQNSVSGKVADKAGSPLPGVTVILKGTSTGTITDSDGNYTLNNVPPNATLIFSFVGMKTQEIAVGGKTNLKVILDEESVSLDEVVAIGYGTQKRAVVVGAVAAITGDAIREIPAPDVTNAISGRLPGTIVRQSSGEPGQDAASILIRGRGTLGSNTAPLVVIDGIPGRALTDIDNSDIASISILKDASAAIYGASAANGVILVTTKKGQDGKPTLTYQFFQGIMEPTQVPQVLNAGDYATYLTEYHVQNGKTRMFTDKDIELYYSGADPWKHPNTNWYSDLIRDWTSSFRHNVTLSGGSKGINYFISVGMKGENAIYKQAATKANQYNLRSKVELPITNWLKTSVEFAAFQIYKRYPIRSAGDIVGQSTRMMPTMTSFWPNGLPGPDVEYGDNPVVTSTLATGSSETNGYKLQTTFNVTITPPFVKGLTLSAYYNLDVNNQYKKRFAKPWVLYSPDWTTATYDPSTGYVTNMTPIPTLKGFVSPELTETYNRDIGKIANLNFNYTKSFGKHSLSLFGAYEQYNTNNNYFDAFRKYYITDVITTLNAGSDLEKTNSGSMSIYARKSFIARFNYSYKDKYLAELVIRRDGSLKFPIDKRFGNFPAVLFGWRASEEGFWKENIPFINYFKLRASYGIVGMDPGDLFQYYNKYQLSTGLIMNKVLQTSVYQSVIANPNITWEKQVTQNIGFESKWFNNKFTFNGEIFYNKRKDILAPRNASVPSFTGLALPNENIAQVDNKGFEAELVFHQKINEDFNFDLGGNFSFNRNSVVFNDEPAKTIPWQVTTGHPYGAILMYNAIGIFADQAAVDAYPHWSGAKPGDVIFEDVSGDGKINADDKNLIDKCDAPEVTYGVTLDVTYKSFRLSVLAQGVGTTFSMNTPDDRRGENGNFFRWNFDDRWTPTHTNATVGRAWDRTNFYWGQGVNNSTYWYSDMAYFRLKNAVLSYDIPNKLFSRLGVSKASISVSGNNLFLIWAAQHYYDPEIASPTSYPAMRTFAVGANITF